MFNKKRTYNEKEIEEFITKLNIEGEPDIKQQELETYAKDSDVLMAAINNIFEA